MLIRGPSVNSYWACSGFVLPTERHLVSELEVCPNSCESVEVWREAPWARSVQISC